MIRTLKKRVGLKLRSNARTFDFIKRVYRLLLSRGCADPLYRYLTRISDQGQTTPFIQVGANDGLTNDPIREFAVWSKWPGICVEPIPWLYQKLKRNYKHVENVNCVNAALGWGESLELFFIRSERIGEFPYWADQIASFDREHLLKHFQRVALDPSLLASIKIETVSFESLFERLGYDPSDTLLLIDTEGYENVIFREDYFYQLGFKNIIFEHTHLDEPDKIFMKLRENGYELYLAEHDCICSVDHSLIENL